MDPLAVLPVFFSLHGERVVVIGGGSDAAWKAELLSAAGAIVDVLAADPCSDMQALSADPPGGPVVLRCAAWSPKDLAGACLIVASAESFTEAARIFAAARAAGIPVNVIDRPACCTFQFGAIVNRSPLVIGISTSGAAPVFAQAIRSRIEALLPTGFKRWAHAAMCWRRELENLDLLPQVRRRFWERFADLALGAPAREPVDADRDSLLKDTSNRSSRSAFGHVTLVGAGPGDPELLTLRAVRALRSADVILFDDLVAPEILDYARREAKRMLVGKTGGRPSCKQEDINALMVGLARAGRRVVRLKAGDPMIFGRGNEEIAALERAEIAFDVVPGITAAQGVAASLKQSLTSRDGARRVQFIAGHARTGRLPDDLDLDALLDPAAATAIYMPLGTLDQLVDRLREAGMDEARRVTAVFNATRPNEHVVAATLRSICEHVNESKSRGPCLVLLDSEKRGGTGGQKLGSLSDCPLTPQPPAAARARAAPLSATL